MSKVVLQDNFLSKKVENLYEKISECNEDASVVRPLLVADGSARLERFDVIHVKGVEPEDLELPDDVEGFELEQMKSNETGALTNKIRVTNFGEIESEEKKTRQLR